MLSLHFLSLLSTVSALPLVSEKVATKHFTSYLIAILLNMFLVYQLLVVSAGPNW